MLLFNVVLEVIVRRANLQTTSTIYKKETQLLAYADDIDIVGRSQSAVRNAYLALEGELAKVGTIRDVGQSVAIGDKHFEVLKEFVYLGSLMTPTNDVSLELQRRIQSANRYFFGLRKHLQSSLISRQTKFTIHKTLIRPVLLYGSETWVLTKREENQLLVFERKVLRTICCPKVENGVYRRRYNHELDKESDSPIALNVTKTSRLRYAAHMIKRPEDLPQKALFRAKPNGRRNQGRPKSMWMDGMSSDSLAVGVRDWTHCAQSRQSWRDGIFFNRP
jgi:hypothetical protein